MTTHSIKLDLDKTLQLPPPTITARQGDTQCGITAMVTDHGAPATLTGYTAKFQAAKPDGTYAEQAAQISGSTVTVELDPQFLAAAGLIRTAYFRFFEGTAEKESTQNMCIRVIHDAEGEAPDLSTSYIPTVDQLVEDATEALNSANTALGNAEEALEDAEAATDSATDAAASANAAANAAQSAIDAMTGNVLRGTVGPSEVVSVEDAYPQVPLGVKVKGVTRQNLWVNPTGTNVGVTVSKNDDGSLSLSGALSSNNAIVARSDLIYTLRPSTEYTLSVSPDTPISFAVQFNDGAITGFSVSPESNVTTFTSPATINTVRFIVFASASNTEPGQSMSGTYRVMLNEGSTAEPWCPPGLNSVEGLEIVQAGKNLMPSVPTATAKGITVTNNGDGSYTVNGTSTATDAVASLVCEYLPRGVDLTMSLNDGLSSGSKLQVMVTNKNGTNTYYDVIIGSNSALTFRIAEEAVRVSVRIGVNSSGITFNNEVFLPQIELGTAATDYEPAVVEATTVNLSSNALRSLPDGTCDVLTIGEDGTAGIERNTAQEDISQKGDIMYSSESPYTKRYIIDDALSVASTQNCISALCNKFPSSSWNLIENGVYTNVNQVWIGSDMETPAEVKSFVDGQAPVIFVYERNFKDSVTLPAVTLPALPGPIANVWAVATDGHGNTFTLQPQIELEYARDVTLVIGSLEAKVAALELLHKSE